MFSEIILLGLCASITVNSELVIPDSLDWWQTSIVYQIYPRSFKDSNDDGIGDLKGIEQQLDYFAELGIDVLWLSPIFESPMNDMGYDVSNFTAIDPLFGTMEDFDSLVRKMKSMDMKIILDFVPNHSSDNCKWFQDSIKRIDPYTNYYVWKDPKGWTNNGTTPVPPNNWVSVFQGSAWEYNKDRKQFYLHSFAVKQPDFNFRSPELVEEMKNVLRFWLNKGVDGFRTDSVLYLYEDINMPDEPVISNVTINGSLAYDSLNHTYTLNQPETYQLAREFRILLDEHSKKDGHTRILLTEAYTTLDYIMKYYGNSTVPIAQVPFNFEMLKRLNYDSNANTYVKVINSWLERVSADQWPNWVLGNHDNNRVASRFSEQLVDGLNMLITLLPGTGITYQGEELGMTDTKIRWDQTTDVLALNVGPLLYNSVTRDPERTPFQWNSTLHAGFSRINGNTWLPVNPNYYAVNVESEKKDPKSHYNVYKSLLKLRQNEVIRQGDFHMYVVSEWVFAFKRSKVGEEMYIVVINLNNQEEYVNLNVSISELPETMNVFIASSNSEYNVNDQLNTGNIGFKMRPNSALVLQAIMRKEMPAHLKGSGSSSKPLVSTLHMLLISVIYAFYFQ